MWENIGRGELMMHIPPKLLLMIHVNTVSYRIAQNIGEFGIPPSICQSLPIQTLSIHY